MTHYKKLLTDLLARKGGGTTSDSLRTEVERIKEERLHIYTNVVSIVCTLSISDHIFTRSTTIEPDDEVNQVFLVADAEEELCKKICLDMLERGLAIKEHITEGMPIYDGKRVSAGEYALRALAFQLNEAQKYPLSNKPVTQEYDAGVVTTFVTERKAGVVGTPPVGFYNIKVYFSGPGFNITRTTTMTETGVEYRKKVTGLSDEENFSMLASQDAYDIVFELLKRGVNGLLEEIKEVSS